MKNNLEHLLNKHGVPDALIDHWDNKSTGFAVWGYDDIILWDNSGLYISNKKVEPSLELVQNTINDWKNKSLNISCIGFINYNFKNILFPHIKFKNYNKNIPYLVFIKPRLIKSYKIEKNNSEKVSLKIMKDFMDYKKYKIKFNQIKKELESGNAYQINFTNNKKYKSTDDGFKLYINLRLKAKPKYGFYLKYNKYEILSFSPELFFHRKNNYIESHPMKGTIKRSKNKLIDNQLKLKLKKSIKDRAEHLMIVDLMRNDIGKIANPGTVKVDKLYEIKSYKTVHQMISKIKGEIDNSIREIDILRALFPGGSITGAPKESAMKIIDCLENYSRDIYTGSLGYITSNGNMKFNIAIRTMTINNQIASYPVGGGIVWDSLAKNEWDEAQLKSKILSSIIQ